MNRIHYLASVLKFARDAHTDAPTPATWAALQSAQRAYILAASVRR